MKRVYVYSKRMCFKIDIMGPEDTKSKKTKIKKGAKKRDGKNL